MERSLYSLALRLKVKFESMGLIRAMVSILKKLKQYGDSFYRELLEGTRLAWVFSGAAVSWGNREAVSWRSERKYIVFLGRFSSGLGRAI
jgi:hypothetical protein